MPDRKYHFAGDIKRMATIPDVYMAILDIHGYTRFCQKHRHNMSMLELLDRVIQQELPKIAAKYGVIIRRARGDEILLLGGSACELFEVVYLIARRLAKDGSPKSGTLHASPHGAPKSEGQSTEAGEIRARRRLPGIPDIRGRRGRGQVRSAGHHARRRPVGDYRQHCGQASDQGEQDLARSHQDSPHQRHVPEAQDRILPPSITNSSRRSTSSIPAWSSSRESTCRSSILSSSTARPRGSSIAIAWGPSTIR